MKLYVAVGILLASVCALTSAAKFEIRDHEDALKAHEECRAERKIPDEIYEQFLNYEFPEHKNTNCYVKCFLEKMGLFTELKGFNQKNIIAQFTHKNTKDLATVQHGLEKCIDLNEWGTDTCTWANRVFSCWNKINRPVVRKTYGAN